jgi:hypothetical protein
MILLVLPQFVLLGLFVKWSRLEQGHPAREALVTISTVPGVYMVAANSQASDLPFDALEAQVIADYVVRNSDVVETTLHAEKKILTDALMPAFNDEISRRVYGLLSAKGFLRRRGLWVWRPFIRAYHEQCCASWKKI